MFESDDYDQILSQFDIPEVSSHTLSKKNIEDSNVASSILTEESLNIHLESKKNETRPSKRTVTDNETHEEIYPKHVKKKMLDLYFDHKSKRKFPGPAGLLNASFKENDDEVASHMVLLSQDVDFSQNCLQRDSFNSPLWNKLLENVKEWNLGVIDTIKGIKQQAITGNLRRRKAETITAFVEAVDRSVIDPLITLRDCTGSIKCTLHRDAWAKFSPYLVSEYCALVLWKPTVLTTGSAFKKHYLNITLNNIFAIYSSAVLNDETDIVIPDEYKIVCKEHFTVIKTDKSTLNPESALELHKYCDDLLQDFDSVFDDEEF